MARMLAAQASFAYCPALQPGADVRGMVNPHTAALEQAANTASARIIAAALVTVTALLCALFVFCYDDGDHMPPRAPVSVAEAVRAMASDGAPRFLYELSCRVGPVFRLPLPTTRRFYVVADADVAAAVLAHPLSTTPSLVRALARHAARAQSVRMRRGDEPRECAPRAASSRRTARYGRAQAAHACCTAPALSRPARCSRSVRQACAEALMLTTDALSIRSTHDAPCEATAWPHLDDARVAAICRTHACGLVHNVIAPAALSGAPVDVCALALRVGLGIICEACLGYVPAAVRASRKRRISLPIYIFRMLCLPPFDAQRQWTRARRSSAPRPAATPV